MEETFTSENIQEVAEPEVSTSDITEDNTDEEVVTEVESTPTEETEKQTAEDNARFAAARRRAEADSQRRVDDEFARRFKDYENPITHQPIRTMQDYLAALDAQETLKRNNELQSKGIDPQMFEDMVSRQVANNPAVLQAQAIMEATQQVQLQTTMDNDLKAIQKMNPNVKSLDDVANGENWNTILDYFNKGLSLPDAYKLANYDVLIANNNASAKQKAINNMKGTQHLNTTDGVSAGGESLVDIPQSELGAWKRAYPDLSLKEITKKYNKTL